MVHVLDLRLVPLHHRPRIRHGSCDVDQGGREIETGSCLVFVFVLVACRSLAAEPSSSLPVFSLPF